MSSIFAGSLPNENVYLCSLNLANAVRDENTAFRFGTRIEIILQKLKQKRSGGMIILAVQEIRVCKDVDGVTALTPLDIILRFARELDMLPHFTGNNGSSLSFWKATFYDPKVLFCTESRIMWAGESKVEKDGVLVPSTAADRRKNIPSGPQACCNALRTTYYVIPGSTYRNYNFSLLKGKRFDVVNVHAPVLFEGRMDYCREVLMEFGGENAIYLGDFNSIPDMGGQEQINLLETRFLNITPEGLTFVGFPGDCDPEGNVWKSSLDKVFLDGDFTFNDAGEERTKKDFPEVTFEDAMVDGRRCSDHFLVTVNITSLITE